jgi:hypothetical protein
MRRTTFVAPFAVAVAVLSASGGPSLQASSSELDRTVLPIQAPAHDPITELDARDATAPPRFEVKAPENAPNVVIVLKTTSASGPPVRSGARSRPRPSIGWPRAVCATTSSTRPLSARPPAGRS